MPTILKCAFEVFGRVQGVSFRMYTKRQAKTLGVRGWCMNTANDTVQGQIEGTPDALSAMKTWLEKTGSPTSRIDKVMFGETNEQEDYSFKDFAIRE